MVRRVINTTFVLTCTHSRIIRTTYHPIGGARCHRGPKIQSHHHLAPQRRLRSPKLKYEALEISEVRGPLEKKSAYALQLFWAPLNARYYTLQLLLGATLKAK